MPAVSRHQMAFIVIGLVHLVAVVCSTGAYHFDEHFQILEFLNYKWGLTPASDLAWEFGHRMRSFTQVAFYGLAAAPWRWLGVENPHFYAFWLRLISSLLGLVSIFALHRLVRPWFKSAQAHELALWLMGLWWFVPYLHARTSSENLTASLFFLGLVLWEREQSKKSWSLFFAGLLLGLSCQVRFQTGFMLAPYLAWRWLFVPARRGDFIFVTLGLALSQALGLIADFWGYGEWVFSAWNYLDQNLLQNRIADQGKTPWWEYLRTGFLRGIPPLSLLLMASTFFFWWKNPRHLLTWIFVPFVLVHMAISGKALRFLFPMILVMPLILALVIDNYFPQWLKKSWWLAKRWRGGLLVFLLGINGTLLLVSSLRSSNVAIAFYRHLQAELPAGAKIYANDDNPLLMVGLPVRFYNPKWFEIQQVTSFQSAQELQRASGGSGFWYYVNRGERVYEALAMDNCERRYTSYPLWALRFDWGGWVRRSRVWGLFWCKI